jgi:predicted lipid-binding transport protein (Tim44 family)
MTYEDVQHPRVSPLTGLPEVDPDGSPIIDHEKLATSRNNFIYIEQVPVFYWPFMATDLDTPNYYVQSVRVTNDKVFGTRVMTDLDAYQVFGIKNRWRVTRWTLSAAGSRVKGRARTAQGCRIMANSQLLDIFLIAMVAGIILFRLYTVLGRRTGHERPPQENYRFSRNPDAAAPADDKVVTLPDRGAVRADPASEQPGDPVARGVLDIKLADRNFETEHFVSGARSAYEMIITAFAKGDRAALRPLLSDEVFGAFDHAIAARETRHETIAFTFVGFKSAAITQAQLKGRNAEVTATFNAQYISATLDAAGTVVEGDTKTVRDVTDIWTFGRDTRASDPNWILIATAGDAV